MHPLKNIAAIASAFLACAGHKEKGPLDVATAKISGYSPNTEKGTIHFTPIKKRGLRIRGEIKGLLANRSYGIHIHKTGNCADPDASGGHFDPGGSNMQGEPGGSPGAHHAGDLPNLATGEDGIGRLDFTTNALGAGASDFTVIGRSIVIHAQPDDYQTQPSGGSGEKIACGVIQPAG